MTVQPWFKIGEAAGLRSLKEQLIGLEELRHVAPRASILDLGCAEGLLGKYYVDTFGADVLHGIESEPGRVATARKLCAGYSETEFWSADLNDRAALDASGKLLERYDIVLALAILHKLTDPTEALLWCAARCRKALVVRMPGELPYFKDARSAHKRFEPRVILGADWQMVSDRPGPRTERTFIFHRAG